MRLLLDMGLSPRTTDHLRLNGHDTVHLRDDGLHQLPDEKVLRKAQDERRVLITFDLDFSRLLALQRLAQPSVILLRLEGFTTEQVNFLLVTILQQYPREMEAGVIIVVDPDRVRIRSLPVW